ncbi:MAG TPA: prepilin peptidase [Candidatus Omnitrophica bacterium]|nr:prepilin peptidase [Candidatus Omnitrophota bacterium]
MLEFMMWAFVFLFGICIGSFLNVCIYRMGREESVVRPGSHCPNCKKPIRPKDNIPLLSYILLRGRCRDCGQRISARYFFVELITGLLFLALYYRFGLSIQGLAYCLLVSGLIIATFVDFDFRIIPDEVSVGGIITGLVISFILPSLHNAPTHLLGLFKSFLGVLVGGGILWLLGCLGDFIFKKESMGGGDVKLLAMIGAFLGWQIALLSLPVASLVGAVVGVIIKLKTKESVIAFGPYLALGAVICIFWSEKILKFFFYL